MKSGRVRRMGTGTKFKVGVFFLIIWITAWWVNWYRSLLTDTQLLGRDAREVTQVAGPTPTWLTSDSDDANEDVGTLSDPLTLSSPLFEKLAANNNCFHIARYSCRSSFWGSIQGDLSIRMSDKESFQLTPVPYSNSSFYFSKCSQERYLVVGEGGVPQFVGVGKGTELTIFQQPFGVSGALMITVAGDTGRSLGLVANVHVRHIEHDDIGSRLDALWTFVGVREKDVTYPQWVHILKGTNTKKANITTNGQGCVKKFRGCCFLKRMVPKLITEKRNKDTDHQQIATLVVSSLVTLSRRLEQLEKSLFNKKDIDVVITTDCHVSFLQSRLEGNVAAWLIGPVSHYLKDFIEINLRVTLSVHWMFRNLQRDWYFVVDDDTLVFTDNLRWLLSSFPQPKENFYYVGHTSEWDEKTLYHGDMPFGGGGIVVSGAIRREWNVQFNKNNPSREFVLSGQWSHSGGDGAVCRLTSWVMARAGVERFFSEVRGFHQLDILGNQGIEDILKKDCPLCPSDFEQSSAWFDDVISDQPVFTLHHIGVIASGSLFPNVSGPATIPLLFSAYNTLPSSLLFLRRHCTEVKGFTICINFGRSVQLYQGIQPEKAMRLLSKESSVDGMNIPEKMRRMALIQEVKLSLVATAYFNPSAEVADGGMEYLVAASSRQLLLKVVTTFSDDSNIAELSVHFEDSSVASKSINISHLVSPPNIAINGEQLDSPTQNKKK